MNKEEYTKIVLDFIKQRLNGVSAHEIMREYIDNLSRLQLELLILQDYLASNHPQDLVNAMNDVNRKSIDKINNITQGWMVRAKLSKRISETKDQTAYKN